MSAATRQTFRLAGGLLGLGSVIFLAGIAFYLSLTPRLGLPASAPEYLEASRDALRDSSAMCAAGRLTSLGDTIIFCAALALLPRRKVSGELERVAWALLGVSFGIAILFDSLMGAALGPLAQVAGAFAPWKSWFDALFAMGNVPFGAGAAGIFWADAYSDAPLLPRGLDLAIVAASGLALAGGVAYLAGFAVLPRLIGIPLIVVTAALAALGVQIARKERP